MPPHLSWCRSIRITAMCRSICVHNLPFIRLEFRISSGLTSFVSVYPRSHLHLQLRNAFRRRDGMDSVVAHSIKVQDGNIVSAMCLPDKTLTRIIVQMYSICSSCSYLRYESSLSSPAVTTTSWRRRPSPKSAIESISSSSMTLSAVMLLRELKTLVILLSSSGNPSSWSGVQISVSPPLLFS